MKLLKIASFLMGSSLLMVSCASYREVPKDYSRVVDGASKSVTDRTVIFILVDGLPVKTLKRELVAGRMPQVDSFFIGPKREMYIARTAFPSVTFTGIGALLTEQPVNQNGLLGNSIFDDRENEVINFEEPRNYVELNRRIKMRNIFSRLKAKGQRTVSLSHSFYADAGVSTDHVDPQAGLALLNQDYEFLDRKTLDSLQLLLRQNKPQMWPDFIFVHLVGIDFLSHRYGPDSPFVTKYLNQLDRELKPVIELLQAAELKKHRKVMALLSSDHGFDQTISSRVELSSIMGPTKDFTVLNEGRFASFYFPKDWRPQQKAEYLQKIAAIPMIEMVVYKQDHRVFIHSAGLDVTVTYSKARCLEGEFAISIQQTRPKSNGVISSPICPEALDSKLNHLYHPYFIANISQYFQTESHPEAVIIPRPGISFHRGTLGQHGGPTANEIFVPLLIHNGTLTDLRRNPTLWQLLRFM